MFELCLFTTKPELACRAVQAGVDTLVVDWEYRGKAERQRGADTQINRDTLDDLIGLRRASSARIIVRICEHGEGTAREIEQAIDGGADEILLPMVTCQEDVRRTLDLVRGRIDLGILIETVAAAADAESLGRLPLRRVFVGLNDLAIQRGTRSIFQPLVDGTLAEIRRHIRVAFGFGGLTHPAGGHPIACRHLMGEMARLGAQFSFLRRSFLRDIATYGLEETVAAIRCAMAEAGVHGSEQMAADQAALKAVVLAPWADDARLKSPL